MTATEAKAQPTKLLTVGAYCGVEIEHARHLPDEYVEVITVDGVRHKFPCGKARV